MKLTKLQQLAEGKAEGKKKVFKMFDPLTDKMEVAHDNVKHVMEQLESAVLTDLLKQEGFPETESKAAKAALKAAYAAVGKAYDELSDLHMALGMHFEDDDLKEAKEPSAGMPPENEERIIRKVLANIEDDLPHEARYKSWDTDSYKKTIDWITQESNAAESQAAARTIAKAIRKAGVKGTGWTVRVVVRDDYRGDKTKWHIKVKV